MRREQSFFSPLSRWCFFSLDFPIRKTGLESYPVRAVGWARMVYAGISQTGRRLRHILDQPQQPIERHWLLRAEQCDFARVFNGVIESVVKIRWCRLVRKLQFGTGSTDNIVLGLVAF